jgi:hypothetical protein
VKTENCGEVLERRWVELGGNEAAAECGPAEFRDRERTTAWADDCDDSGEEIMNAWRLPASETLPGQITARTVENDKRMGRQKPATANFGQCEGAGDLS